MQRAPCPNLADLLMDSCGPPTTARERKPQLGGSVYLCGHLFIVARVAISIYAVLVGFHCEVSFGKNDSSISRFRGVQSVMAPTYQSRPFLLATTT